MKFFLLLIICFLSWAVCSAQDKRSVLESNPLVFKQLLEKFPIPFTFEDWKFTYGKAETSISTEQYRQAANYSSKAVILAEKLQDNLLIARSNYQSGIIQTHLLNYQKARECFQQATLFYAKTEKLPQNRLEVGFLLKDWAFINSNPEFIYSRQSIKTALFYLFQAHKISSSNTLPAARNLRIQSSIQIANCFAATGNYLAQIIWLESAMAEISDSSELNKLNLFDIYLGFQSAYRMLGSYEDASHYLKKSENMSEEAKDQNKKLRYLRQLADFYTQINDPQKRDAALNSGITLSKKLGKSDVLADFYSAKLFKSLEDKNIPVSIQNLILLEALIKENQSLVNVLDVYVAHAVIAGYQNDPEKSNSYFQLAEKCLAELNQNESSNAIFLRAWQSRIASFQKNYERLKTISEHYLEIVNKTSNNDSLPIVYTNLAEAFAGLGNLSLARKYNQSAVDLIELKRQADSAQISTGVMEGLYNAYQQSISYNLSEGKTEEGFLVSEKLKARWLSDKISINPLKRKTLINENIKPDIYNASLKLLENSNDEEAAAKLSELEKAAFIQGNIQTETDLSKVSPHLAKNFESSDVDSSVAIISYAFTDKNNLTAFVCRKGDPIRAINLNLTLDEIDEISVETSNKIKSQVFFKQDGKGIFDKLISPLELSPAVKHLIIVPDKSLWKIPFQALSADGEKYLIEDKLISYAPSVSILLEQIKNVKPLRRTLQSFANSSFDGRVLQYVNTEASSVAQIYGSQPILSATVSDFARVSDKADVLHFSMHAQVDTEQPLDSFLGFKKFGKDDGRLTVEELLNMKLKKGSLAFLASCDTNNILSGEGLISLAWAMMGSGATTVVSAQWEANDKSTQTFTKAFYSNYKQGDSSAEALQKASLELIKNKYQNMHEPYYWANFTLNGDFR